MTSCKLFKVVNDYKNWDEKSTHLKEKNEKLNPQNRNLRSDRTRLRKEQNLQNQWQQPRWPSPYDDFERSLRSSLTAEEGKHRLTKNANDEHLKRCLWLLGQNYLPKRWSGRTSILVPQDDERWRRSPSKNKEWLLLFKNIQLLISNVFEVYVT